MRFIRQNATHKVICGPFVDVLDGATKETGLLLSTADQAEALKHDGTAVVDISGYTWAAITTMTGYYNLTLQAAISDTVGHLILDIADVSLCLPRREEFTVLEETAYDAMFAVSAAGFSATSTITVGEQAQGAPPLAPTEQQILSYLYMRLIRNKKTTDSTDHIIFADNGTTQVFKVGITDSAGTFTEAEAVTGV